MLTPDSRRPGLRSGIIFLSIAIGMMGPAAAQVVPASVGTAPESFLQGLAHTLTWLGNKLLPLCIGLFIIGAILSFARQPALAVRLGTAAFLCALGTSIFRLFDTVFVGTGYDAENALLIGMVRMINYVGCVALPILGAVQVAITILKLSPHSHYAGVHHSHGFGLNLITAIGCLLAPALTRLIEHLVTSI